jgi:hypothetical protein
MAGRASLPPLAAVAHLLPPLRVRGIQRGGRAGWARAQGEAAAEQLELSAASMVAVARQGCGRPVAPPLLCGGLDVAAMEVSPLILRLRRPAAPPGAPFSPTSLPRSSPVSAIKPLSGFW